MMKYLKTFGSISPSETFEKINNFHDCVYGDDLNHRDEIERFISKNWVAFTDSELKEIKKIFKNVVVDYSYSKSGKYAAIEIKYRSVNTNTITVIKLKDEWFYVWSFIAQYRCDQLDGLIECLSYLKNDNHEIS